MSQRLFIDLPPEFVRMCHGHGVAPDLVLRSFIGDLCGLVSYLNDPREDGYGSNGAQQHRLALEYYEGCGYPFGDQPAIR